MDEDCFAKINDHKIDGPFVGYNEADEAISHNSVVIEVLDITLVIAWDFINGHGDWFNTEAKALPKQFYGDILEHCHSFVDWEVNDVKDDEKNDKANVEQSRLDTLTKSRPEWRWLDTQIRPILMEKQEKRSKNKIGYMNDISERHTSSPNKDAEAVTVAKISIDEIITNLAIELSFRVYTALLNITYLYEHYFPLV